MKYTSLLVLLILLNFTHNKVPQNIKAFGVIDDSYEVNHSGAYNHVIPLHVSPGIKGFAPNLAVIYDSRSGISDMGYGWSLTGISKIVRGPNNFAQHGQYKGVDFTTSDVLLLDGQYLTVIEGTNTLPKSAYRTENETFSIIRALGTIVNSKASAKYFVVLQANGLKYFYGKTDDSRVEITLSDNRREVLEWNVSRVEDNFGNFMDFEYQQNDNKAKIISIKYTGNTRASVNPSNEVVFNYETEKKRNTNLLFMYGIKQKNDDILNSIGMKTNGRFFKFYQFSYNDKKTQLLKVTESADEAGANALLPTTISYNKTDSLWFAQAKAFEITNFEKSKLFDFDNDGIEEKVVVEKRVTDGRDSLMLTITTSENGDFKKEVFNAAIDAWPGSNVTGYEDKILFPDINGDGLRDIVTDNMILINITTSGDYRFRLLNTSGCAECSKFITFNGNDSKLLAKDLDGDGRDELVLINLNKANGLLQVLGFNQNDQFVKLGELSGNFPINPSFGATLESGSIEELVVLEKDNATGRRISLRKGKLTVRPIIFPTDLPVSAIGGNDFTCRDFNLDGIDDIALLKDNGPIQCWLFNGINFLSLAQGNPGYFNGNNPKQRSHIGFFTSSDNLQLLNINGNALQLFNINFFEQGQISFTEELAPKFTLPEELVENSSAISYYDWEFTELNGDGNIDIKLKTKKDGSFSGIKEFHSPYVFINKINSVKDGFNNNIFIEYANIRDRLNYIAEKVKLEDNYLIFSGHYIIVKTVRFSNGLSGDSLNTIDFKYRNLILEKTGRGLAGFQQFNKIEKSAGVSTQTILDYKFPFTGKILEQKKSTLNGVVYFEQYNHWGLKQYREGIEPKENDRVKSMLKVKNFNNTAISYLPVLNKSDVIKRELDNVISSRASLSYTYNALAQIEQTTTVFGDGSSSISRKSYRNINTNITENGIYILGLVSTDVSFTFKGSDTTPKRTMHYEYDSNRGFLKSSIRQKGAMSLELKEEYSYDLAGNLTSKKTFAGNGSEIKENYTYSEDLRFLERTTNAVGFETKYIVEPAYGSQLSVTDPNGLENIYEYDQFGNIILEKTPDGRTRKYSYAFLEGSHDQFHGTNSNALYKLTIEETGAKEVIKYYDKIGREVSSLYFLLDSTYTATTSSGVPPFNRKTVERKVLHFVQYDNKGNVRYDYKPEYVQLISQSNLSSLGSSSNPGGGKCVQFEDSVRLRTEYTYDEFNRPILIKLPDGKTIRKEFFADKQVEHDPDGRKMSTFYDQKKMITAVADDRNSLIRYEYDLAGNLNKIVNPTGNSIEMSYDALGRKTSIADPAFGRVIYEYDVLGRLIQERWGSRVIEMQYDSLSRLTRKTIPGKGSILWSYDKVKKGAIDLIVDIQGNQYRYLYDKFSRIESEFRQIQGKTFTTRYTYDAMSRIKDKAFPNGYSVSFEYVNNMPVKIRETKTDKELWSVETVNQEGKVTNKSFGNGVLTSYAFNKSNGVLESIETRKTDFSFRPELKDCPITLEPDDFLIREFERPRLFDPSNPQPGWTDPVRPDIINGRLNSQLRHFAAPLSSVSVTVQRIQSFRYEYDNKYNIKTKYDLVDNFAENYSYDNLNRLEQVVFGGSAPSRPHLTMTYDDKGNITSKSDQGTYEYDGESVQRVKFITSRGTLAHEFMYDEFGNVTTDKVTGLKLSYTYFNKPDTIEKSNLKRTIVYGPFNEEVSSSVYDNSNLKTATIKPFADYEVIKQNGSELSQCYVMINGDLIAIHSEEKSESSDNTVSFNLFVHKDHLGSIHAITNEQGTLVARYRYSVFGEQSLVAGSAVRTLKGFTSHEQLVSLDLINASGRYYMPAIARFVSADPYAQTPTDLQSLNRYSYVRNNPVNHLDPSGFFWKKVTRAIGGAVSSVAHAVHNVGRAVASVAEAAVALHVKIFEEGERFVNKYGKQILIIAAAAAITYFSGGTLAGFGAAMIKGAIIGAVIGAGITAVRGGSFQEILNAGFSGAISGAAAGAMAYGLSSAAGAMFKEASYGKHLLGGINGYVSTGGSEEGLYKGVLASFIPEDCGATEAFQTDHYANFFLQVVSSSARGFVVDGEKGMYMQAIGTIGTNAIGHLWGYYASGWKAPEFEKGVYLYESRFSGSIAIGNAATIGKHSWDDKYNGLGFLDPKLRDHETKHYTEQNTLGAAYLPVHAIFAIPGTPVSGMLDRPPFNSNPAGGGY